MLPVTVIPYGVGGWGLGKGAGGLRSLTPFPPAIVSLKLTEVPYDSPIQPRAHGPDLVRRK